MKLTGCNGCELASFDQQIPFFEGHISREDTITQEREIQVVELRASHLDIARETVKHVFHVFDWLDVTDGTSFTGSKSSSSGNSDWRRYGAGQLPRNKSWNMDLTVALNILTDALVRCCNEDMRTVEVFPALDALALNATAQWPFEQFRKALEQ